jgi:hypothetical protein
MRLIKHYAIKHGRVEVWLHEFVASASVKSRYSLETRLSDEKTKGSAENSSPIRW